MHAFRRRAVRLALLVALVPAAGACERAAAPPPSRICLALLARKLPSAQVIETADTGERTEIRYTAEDADGATVAGTFSCRFEATESGHLRLRSAALDGSPLLPAELAVINADLLLDDLHRTARAERRVE